MRMKLLFVVIMMSLFTINYGKVIFADSSGTMILVLDDSGSMAENVSVRIENRLARAVGDRIP